MSTSNIFSNVYIYGNCTVKGTLTTLGGSAVSQWTTAGSTIYYSTGNVGIGTNNPTGVNASGTVLHVADSTANNPTVHVDASVGTGQARLHLRSGTGSTNRASRIDFFNNVLSSTVPQWTIISGYDQNGTNDMRYVNYAGAITMAWAQNGNIGIGTTNPGSLLTVSGGVGIGSGYNAFTAPTNGMIVQGGVGIGTSNPGVNALQVTGNVVTSGFTSNATNTVFNFDTLTVPFVNATQIGSTSTSSLQISSNVDLNTGTINVATISCTNGLMFRNRVINGDCRFDQRNNGASVTNGAGGDTWLVDRFFVTCRLASKLSAQKSTVVPTGFSNSLLITSLSAYTPVTSDYYGLGQRIEGYNIADLNWGTASALPVTISFWVNSSVTGTYPFGLEGQGYTPSYVTTYTITSASTWQYVTIIIPGPTIGTWNTTNGLGTRLWWDLGSSDTTYATTPNVWAAGDKVRVSGSVNFVATNAATFYITGIQFEKGPAATPFEFRPYPTELSLCQRYYNQFGTVTTGGGGNTGNIPYTRLFNTGASTFTLYPVVYLPTSMRATPTGTIYYDISDGTITSAATGTATSTSSALIGVSLTTGQWVDIDGWQLSAEL